jgi:serine protease Do
MMSTRKTTLFYAMLIAVSSMAVGLVIASRLDLTPASQAQTFTAPPMNSAPVTGALDAQTFRNVAKAVSPIVVNIRTETRRRQQDLTEFFGGGGQTPDDLFRRFFGDPPDGDPQAPGAPGGRGRQQRETPVFAAGTGFIISKDGLILTNNHVVEGANKIEVSLYAEDDQTYEAKLIGRDQLTDSALIQLIEKPNHALPEAKFGDSSQMAAGDWVIAIGNPFGYRHTVTVGVISATERPFPVSDLRFSDMLQTDAAINPGNSGGPLLNIRGEVIGMNTAIISNGRQEGNIGIGFAVPINAVRDLLPQLHTGKVIRGRIGVQISAVPPDAYQEFGLKSRAGAVVGSVEAGGAADKGGVKPGDVVVEYNGRPVATTSELVKMVTATKPGTTVPLKVMRSERGAAARERTLNVTVEELDLEAEQGRQARNAPRGGQPQETGADSFGLSLQNITPARARQLQLPAGTSGAVITDVDPGGPSAGVLRPGDVILSVNGQAVSNATEAAAELQQVATGRYARVLLWRGDGEVFVTVRKE